MPGESLLFYPITKNFSYWTVVSILYTDLLRPSNILYISTAFSGPFLKQRHLLPKAQFTQYLYLTDLTRDLDPTMRPKYKGPINWEIRQRSLRWSKNKGWGGIYGPVNGTTDLRWISHLVTDKVRSGLVFTRGTSPSQTFVMKEFSQCRRRS